MNPTKEETDATLERIQMETDQVFYHDLGNHNRAIARERIDRFRQEKHPITNQHDSGAPSLVVDDILKRTEPKHSDKQVGEIPIGRRFLRWLKKWSDRT